jgi:DNA-binding PadR family transcriptional regulator
MAELGRRAGRRLYSLLSMTAPHPPALSLTEWLVLGLASEGSTHGFAIARLLGHQGELGQVWRVPKPVIYRGLARLEQLGLVHTVGEQSTSLGPVRSVVEATPEGRQAAAAWLVTPVRHIRDVRSELMVKLALLDRSAVDPQPPRSPVPWPSGSTRRRDSTAPSPCGGTRRCRRPCASWTPRCWRRSDRRGSVSWPALARTRSRRDSAGRRLSPRVCRATKST